MNIFNVLKKFFEKLLKNKKTKMLEPPKAEVQIKKINSDIKRNTFKEQLKINNKEIETIECINDGLGFQKIKNY